jgi:hypothetical protein
MSVSDCASAIAKLQWFCAGTNPRTGLAIVGRDFRSCKRNGPFTGETPKNNAGSGEIRRSPRLARFNRKWSAAVDLRHFNTAG